MSDSEKPILFEGMIRVRNCHAQDIAKHRRRFTERNLVRPQIVFGLVGVRFEFHTHQCKSDEPANTGPLLRWGIWLTACS